MLQATAVARPFSNGRAERTIKTFKEAARKYFFQTGTSNQWDDHLTWIINALNSSVNSNGYSPEEIMFGTRILESHPLIDTEYTNPEEQGEPTVANIIEKAKEARKKYIEKKLNKQASNITFKNKEAEIRLL